MRDRPAARPATDALTAIEPAALTAAVRLFTSRFVVAAKQAQLAQRLSTAARRAETLAALPRWLGGAPTPLAGGEQSPTGIEARFGPMTGVYVDGERAGRTTIGGALTLARGRAALFVADSGRVALVARDGEPPLISLRL